MENLEAQNNVQVFNNEDIQLPVRENNGEVGFDAEASAIGLGLTQTKNGKTYVRWETVSKYLSQHVGKGDWISEPDFYTLAIKANNETAKKFQYWVTHEVLPTIRKHGAYMTPETMKQALTDPDFIINLATQLKEEQRAKEIEKQKRIEAEKRVDFFKPRAAYYQMILDNPKLVTASEIADYYDMTTVAFNQLLHELKVQYKQGKTWRLYSKHKGKGWASMSKRVIHVNGVERIVESMKWTPHGQLELYKLLKKNGIVPIVERGHDYDVVE